VLVIDFDSGSSCLGHANWYPLLATADEVIE
jgi:hypothetical protein